MMRRLFLYFLLLASLGASAQYTPSPQYISGKYTIAVAQAHLRADSTFWNAVRDTNFTPLRIGIQVMRAQDSSIYVSTSIIAPKKWTKMGSGGGTAAWGNITGSISSQSDLMALLNAKQNLITTGTVSQYIRGNLSLGDFASDVLSVTDGAYAAINHSHDGLIPPGGGAGQILMKNSGANFDYFWSNPPSGGTVTSVFGRTGAISAQSSDYASYYKPVGWFPAFNEITSKPNTLAGYGITDAYTTTQVVGFFTGTTPIIGYNKTNWDAAYSWGNHAGLYRPISYVPTFSELLSKPTTLSGYGITDAYTKTEVDNKGYLTNITGKVQAGTNVTLSGAGTTASPYVINASGGGTATDTTSLSNRINSKLTIPSAYNANFSKVLVQDTATGNVYRQSAAVLNLTSPTNGQTLIYSNGEWVNGAAASGIAFKEWYFKALGGQTAFTNDTIVGKHVKVYREREEQWPDEDYVVNNNTITFLPTLSVGERIRIEASTATAWASTTVDYSGLQAISWSSTSTTFTQSPTGTWTSSVGAYGVGSPLLPAGSNGWVQMDYPSTASRSVVLGFAGDNVLEQFSDGSSNYNFPAFYVNSNGYYTYGNEGAQGTVSSTLASIGDKLRIRRTGGTLYAEKSSDGGTTWTLIFTYSGTYNGNMYAKTFFGTSNLSLVNPKIYIP